MKMRLILIALFSLCASCVSNPNAEAHRLALWNFRYQSDIDNEYRIYDSIAVPFYGDCEDFSLSLQKIIGGDVWVIKLSYLTYHAALVNNGMVYDNRFKRPMPLAGYSGEFIYIIKDQ
jgi:hypothetical protein